MAEASLCYAGSFWPTGLACTLREHYSLSKERTQSTGWEDGECAFPVSAGETSRRIKKLSPSARGKEKCPSGQGSGTSHSQAVRATRRVTSDSEALSDCHAFSCAVKALRVLPPLLLLCARPTTIPLSCLLPLLSPCLPLPYPHIPSLPPRPPACPLGSFCPSPVQPGPSPSGLICAP